MVDQVSLESKVASVRSQLLPVTSKKLASIRRKSWLRAKLWGLVLSIFSAGLTTFNKSEKVAGVPLFKKVRLPEGSLIVVANHVSHVDSVALITMIGRTRPVLVAAAADYWLVDKASEITARTAIGIWPIRRGGDLGFEDLSQAGELIKEGVVLVVFAEGGRSETGELGTLRTGAFRLAEEIGATLLPIAILGSAEALPRNSMSTKHKPINLRLGSPRKVQDAVSATREVEEELKALTAIPVINQPGFGYSRVKKIAFSWIGLAVIFFWAFGEGIIWPLIAEMPLLLLIVTVGFRWRGALLIFVAALGSVLGVLTTWWLVSHGIYPPSPLTAEPMFDYARNQLQSNPNSAFWDQMWNGIPVKVYAHEAGVLQMSFVEVLSSLLPRVIRIALLGIGGWLLGTTLAKWLKPNLGLVQSVALIAFPFGLFQALWFWSEYK